MTSGVAELEHSGLSTVLTLTPHPFLASVACADEPVHLPAVDVGLGVRLAVRPAAVDVRGVVVGRLAPTGGMGTHTVGTPFFIGMPSAPG